MIATAIVIVAALSSAVVVVSAIVIVAVVACIGFVGVVFVAVGVVIIVRFGWMCKRSSCRRLVVQLHLLWTVRSLVTDQR